jgi:hypothetical protein
MPIRLIRSLIAAWLVVLLGVLHTGMPSHSHDLPDAVNDGQVLRADQHAHGTLLLEQAERIQSHAAEFAALPATADRVAARLPVRTHAAIHTMPLRPPARAPPPSNASRAPPRHT